jgi:hypothetical protein
MKTVLREVLKARSKRKQYCNKTNECSPLNCMNKMQIALQSFPNSSVLLIHAVEKCTTVDQGFVALSIQRKIDKGSDYPNVPANENAEIVAR